MTIFKCHTDISSYTANTDYLLVMKFYVKIVILDELGKEDKCTLIFLINNFSFSRNGYRIKA